MEIKQNVADVGVIVARFQVDILHDAHTSLINHVMTNHEKVLIFLGLAPTRGTISNPLDFEARKQMVLEIYPTANVLYMMDIRDDKIWSTKLDEQIKCLTGPNSTAMLYGGRDSFAGKYFGKWPTTVLHQEKYVSGTEIRKRISKVAKNERGFRMGAIWQAHNQYPALIPTVDGAIWNDEGTELLMACKPNEKLYRFVGGFAQSHRAAEDCYELEIRREIGEETGLETSPPKYVGSCMIDDWRYWNELDKIGTIFFEVKRLHGHPTPMDDIEELRWIPVEVILNSIEDWVVPEHIPLFNMLMKRSQYYYKNAGK